MHVELNVTEGPAKGQHFIFEQPDCFLFGRSADAQISLPEDKHLSRQHFMLEISPPNCRLIDLESKNGVFVNGIRYGGRKPPKPGIKLAPDGAREVWLQDGDEITVGDTRLTISIRQGNTRVDEQTGRHIVTDKAEQSTDTSLVTSLRLPEYHIEREIGRGSTGVMYKATEIKTETPAAIKTVVSQVSIDSQKTRLFQRELDIICQLKHKHIVRLLKHGKAEGIFLSSGF